MLQFCKGEQPALFVAIPGEIRQIPGKYLYLYLDLQSAMLDQVIPADSCATASPNMIS